MAQFDLLWLVTLSALAAGLYSIYLQKVRPKRESSREENRLRARIKELEAQVDMLLGKLARATMRMTELEDKLRQFENRPGLPDCDGPELVVGVGTDAMLQLDLAILRKVKAHTGLDFERITPVTKAGLDRVLGRRRRSGDPVPYLHLSVHAGPTGLQFADGIADGIWLSEHLSGVRVLLIAGCSSDQPADLAAAAECVVSFREDVPNGDAADACEVFWTAIGQGLSGREAYQRTRERCPAVAEYLEMVE
jgi:hypothetical protein